MAGRFTVGDWTITPELNSLERAGHAVRVEPKMMQVLLALAEDPGKVVSKDDLLHKVWPDTFVTDEVLTRSVSELRKLFQDDARDPTYIETIPKSGYRLVAPVVRLAPSGSDTTRGRWHRFKWIYGTAIAIILLAIAASFYFATDMLRIAPKSITSLAVLPLANLSGDAGQDYFADGMTDELITRLSKISALRVISRTSVMHYKGTKMTAPEIARELNVDALVEGSVLRAGNRVRISAQLIQIPSDKHLWAESYDRDLHDVLALQADVARAIAERINIQITPQEHGKLVAAAVVNPQAHDSYLKGNYYWNKFTEEGMRKAVDYFQQAIQQDPNYAAAYAGLAHAYHELAYYVAPREIMPKAKEAATRALQLDETDAEAHAALGWIKSHYDWDWSGAAREYRRALELNPGSKLARGQYGIFLETMGRFQEGIAEHQKVIGLDPLSLIERVALADAYFNARRYDEAVEQYQKALEIDPNFAPALPGLGYAYLQQGKFPDAVAALQKAAQVDTDLGFTAALAIAYASSGNTKEARKILSRLIESSRKGYVSSMGIALIYSTLGNQRDMCKWLEKSYEARDSNLPDLYVDPYFDGVRSTPCVQSIILRMGFPREASAVE